MALVLFAHPAAPWWVAAAIFACIAVPAEAGTIVKRVFGGKAP